MIFFAAPVEVYPNYLAALGTITATNTEAAFPASNLLGYDVTRPMKLTSAATSTVIDWDFGVGREFDVVSLVHSSLSYKATWVIAGSNDKVTFTTLKSSGPFSAHLTTIPGSWTTEDTDPRRGILNRNKSLWQAGSVLKYRYIRVTVTGDATLDKGFTLGRLFIGRKFIPSTGWQYGSSFTFSDTGRRERTDRGALILDPGETIVQASVKMEFLTAAEMYDFSYEFNYWLGSSRVILACLDTSDVARMQKNTLYCTIIEGRTISIASFNTHSQTWILESTA